MEHIGRRGGLATAGKSGVDRSKLAEFPSRLQMYSVPPTNELSLEEFEVFALERMKVLKAVERAKLRDNKRGTEYSGLIKDALRKHLLLESAKNARPGDEEKLVEQRRKDHVSHFILRLAYCRTEELRRWFLANECELFRYNCEAAGAEEVDLFLTSNDLKYAPIPTDEKARIKDKLRWGKEQTAAGDYFKVPFESVVDLVARRKVYVQRGFAYVPRSELISILMGVFRQRLAQALMATAKALPQMEEDERVLPMLNNMSKQYLGSTDYGKVRTGSEVTADQLNALAAQSFPLCMRNLHQNVRERHHLRHGGRMQYGLFLKGIGLSLEEAMVFWRGEFSKSMGPEKFDKEHAYNIRHNYGQEGKRTNYTPYSCMKIISGGAPGAGDHHGCPFRHFDAGHLKSKLKAYGVKPAGITELLDLVKDHHYQIACTKYFELTHDLGATNFRVEHPNEYFNESRKIRAPEGAAVEAAAAVTANGVKAEPLSPNGGPSRAAVTPAASTMQVAR